MNVAPHQVEIFIMEPGTNPYLGRLCIFNTCPKGKFKRECLAPSYGTPLFLQQQEGFVFSPDALKPGKTVPLYKRQEAKRDSWETGSFSER